MRRLAFLAFAGALASGFLSLSCGVTGALFQEVTDPMTTGIRKHFASEKEARGALDDYVDAASELTGLTAGGPAHLDCLYEYFCYASGHDEEPIRSDATCFKALKRLDKASLEAFGRYHSRWFGDVFGWVVYGDDGKRDDKQAKLARMHLMDEYAVEVFSRFWSEHESDPVAIAVIRGYSGERWAACCREEQTWFFWADRMEPALAKDAADHPEWNRLTVGCNGDAESTKYRLQKGGE